MVQKRRKFIKNSFLLLLSITVFKSKSSTVFFSASTQNEAYAIKIGKNSYLVNGWVVTENDLSNFEVIYDL